MKVYYIKENNSLGQAGGSKARQDIERVFVKRKYSPIFPIGIIFGAKTKIQVYTNKFIKIINSSILFFMKNKNIVVQYPQFFWRKSISKRLYKNNNVYFIIHDIPDIQMFDNKLSKQTLFDFNNAAGLIVHNKKMLDKLREYGVSNKNIICLNLFDYLLDDQNVDNDYKERFLKKSVLFAGNLDKSEFLQKYIKMSKNYNLELFGKDDKKQFSNTDVYKGSFKSDVIPSKMDGTFGLVWDGPSVETETGNFGKYNRINNPHKLSLYISSGTPVIVWDEAAIADFVNEHKIGFTIKKLSDINNIFDKLSIEEYEKMIKNVQNIRKDIVSGKYINDALDKLIEGN